MSCQCRLCKKSFSSKSDLEKHEETHQKLLPCTFPDCERRFSAANELKIHAIDHILSNGLDKKEVNESTSTKSKLVKREIDMSLKVKQEIDTPIKVKEEKNNSIKLKEEKDTSTKVKKERDIPKIKEERDYLLTVKEEKDGSVKNEVKEDNNKSHLIAVNIVKTDQNKKVNNKLPRREEFICDVCQKVLETNGSLKIHMRIHTGQKPFTCKQCGKSLRHGSSFRYHKIRCLVKPSSNQAEDENKVVCKTCDKYLSTEATLKIHMRIHTGEKPYSCEQCTATFRQKPALYLHNSKHHGIYKRKRIYTGEKPYSCEHCKATFTQKSSLYYHNSKHHGISIRKRKRGKYRKLDKRLLECTICNLNFETRKDFKDHITIHKVEKISIDYNNKEKPFGCDFNDCSRRAQTAQSIKNHSMVHIGIRPYACKICPFRAIMRTHLDVHERSHNGERPNKCKFCGRGFNALSALIVHERIHTGEKPFQCDLCPKKFRKRWNMKTHRVSHTGDKLYPCDKCSKTFKIKPSLRGHQKRSHKAENPECFTCAKCSMTFKRQDTQRFHMERLSEGGPYSCFVCDKVFCFNRDLKMHCSKMHSGDKLYPCDKCSMAFVRLERQKDHKERPTEKGPLSCPVCAKLFCFSRDMKMHRSTHYVKNTDIQGESTSQSENRNKIECLRCYKEFSRYEYLFKHEDSGNCKGNPFKPTNTETKHHNPTVEDKENEINLKNEISNFRTGDTEKYKNNCENDLQKRKKSYTKTESERIKRSRISNDNNDIEMVNSETDQLGSAGDSLLPNVNYVQEDIDDDEEEEFYDALEIVEKEIENYSMLQDISKIPEQKKSKSKSLIEVLKEKINTDIPSLNNKAAHSLQNEIDLEIEKYSDENKPNSKSMNNISKNKKELYKGRNKIDSNEKNDILNVYEEIHIYDETNLLNKFVKFVKEES